MESILIIDSIDVKKYGVDDDADNEIDDGRPSISLSAPSSFYEKKRRTYEKKSARTKW